MNIKKLLDHRGKYRMKEKTQHKQNLGNIEAKNMLAHIFEEI